MKAATAGLIGLAILVCAGTGFAAFSSVAYLNGSTTAGTLGPLVWGSSPTHLASAANDVCGATTGNTVAAGDTLILSAGNLAPGDECTFEDSLNNMGTIPATATEQVTSASGGLCAVTVFQDNFFSPSTTIGSGGQTGATTNTVSPGPTFVWGGDIQLAVGTGDGYQDMSCMFMITLTGTAGT
jgi:hypothetical protein